MLKNENKIRIITFLTVLLFLSIQVNAFSIDVNNKNIKSEVTPIKKWTYLTYASWDATIGNSLVKNDTQHLLDIMKSIGSDENLNIVMLLDSMFPDDETKLNYFEKDNIIDLTWDEKDSDMGDKDTLVKFVKKVKTEYPAENYALILSSPRGMGWQGICHDDDTAKARTQSLFELKNMDMPELSSALREVTNNGRDKIDVIGFATCITGSIEVAYQIAPFANYMVASEENMQSFTSNQKYAWPVNKSLNILKNNTNISAEEFAKCIVKNFHAAKNTSAYIGIPFIKRKVNVPVDTTLAAVNLSKISEVAVSIDNLASSLIDNMRFYKKKIKEARLEARKFGPWYARTVLGYFLYLPVFMNIYEKLGIPFFMDVWVDPYHFSELLSASIDSDDPDSDSITDECYAVMNAINNSIIALNVSEGDNAHGLHIYFPSSAQRHNKHLWYIGLKDIYILRRAYACYEDLDFAEATSWNEMLYKVYGIPDCLIDLWLKQKMRIL